MPISDNKNRFTSKSPILSKLSVIFSNIFWLNVMAMLKNMRKSFIFVLLWSIHKEFFSWNMIRIEMTFKGEKKYLQQWKVTKNYNLGIMNSRWTTDAAIFLWKRQIRSQIWTLLMVCNLVNRYYFNYLL